MKKRILRLLILAVLVAGVWWYIQSRQPGTTAVEQFVMNASDALLQATSSVSMPPPLRATQESPTAKLTQTGVLLWTNVQRRNNGDLAPLAPNAELDAAARAKLQDLFAHHYFEHISPTGIGPSDLAKEAGYDYAVIGENLALGNFTDDQELVQAWMDSPGHRANILSTGYDEIGLAVGQGTFEGHRTWIAVQEFGKPTSACPAIDGSLKTKILADEATVKQMAAEAKRKKAALDALSKPDTSEERVIYNQSVDAYNAAVTQINDSAAQIKSRIDLYNTQVRAFNACAQGK